MRHSTFRYHTEAFDTCFKKKDLHSSFKFIRLSMSPSSAGMVPPVISREKRLKDGLLEEIHPVSHAHNSGASMLLWMLVDGVGLAIIAACTILEGFQLWNDYFNEYLEFNVPSLTFWFSGRFCQLVGLISLIIHAASMQVFHELELAGMMMLTAGPVLNLCACSIFDSGEDTSYIFNKQWMTSESLELLGIVVLDISLIEGPEHLVLSAEIAGFFILACAAVLDFEYTVGNFVPSVTLRIDLIHLSDCFGLSLLTVVAIGQYYIKVAKHKTLQLGLNHQGQHNVSGGSVQGRTQQSKYIGPHHKRGPSFGQSEIEFTNSFDRHRSEEMENGDIGLSEKCMLLDTNSSSKLNQHQAFQGQSIHRINSNLSHTVGQIMSNSVSISSKIPPRGTTILEKRHNGSAVLLNGTHEQHND